MLRASQLTIAATLAFVSSVAGCQCDGELEKIRATLIVNPNPASLSGLPVSQDTPIVFQVPNGRTVNLDNVTATLDPAGDPAFTLVKDNIDRVQPGQTEELVVNVRPLVEGKITTTLFVVADDPNVVPNHVEVPITVDAVNVGLPDIEVDPVSVDFDTIGRADLGRENVNIKNVGVRDLILDAVYLDDNVDGVFSIAIGGIARATPPNSQNVGPRNANEDVTIIFQPQDTERHEATLVIVSNDPDETEVRVPLSAQAVECPIAIAKLVDEGLQIEPFDTVRIDGRESHAVAAGTFIPPPAEGGYQWSLLVRPIGSTAVLASETNDRTELQVDLAGFYQVQLDVFAADTTRPENNPIRSCLPATVDVNVIPSDDLHIQLVWDHPTADFDLHVLKEGGTAFTHEGDCYFSNRDPLGPDTPGGWSLNPDENPRLDVDDSRGYGPENINIKHPAPGSKWTVLVHYWNKQTNDVPNANAILRLFVYGNQAIELQQDFVDDQQIWQAIEIVWGEGELAPPTLSQLGSVEPFLRPF